MSSPNRDDASSPVVRALGGIAVALLFVAVVLGVGKRGHPLWAPARALFLPAGVLMMLQAGLLAGRRSFPLAGVKPTRALAAGLFVCGVGMVGIGLEWLDPDRLWSALTI